MKLKDIADSFELETIGNVDKEISGLASLENAGPDDLAFLFSRHHRESLVSSEAGAFVLKKEDQRFDRWPCHNISKSSRLMGFNR